MGAAQRLIAGCTAKEFQERLEKEVFPSLPEKPTLEQLDRIKLRVQTLYQEYRKSNPCRGTLVAHRCVSDVYHEALDRLYVIEPVIVPPGPPSPRRRKKAQPPAPTHEETVIEMLRTFQKDLGGSGDTA